MEKLSLLQGKTPISYLQELCTKRNITPQYDLIANEGAVHEPTFVFRVIAGEFFGTGKGPSKKKAKHSAALSILSQMLGLSQSSFQSDEGVADNKDSDDLAGNPVGDLQEFSQRKLWPPPEYVFSGEQGPPHAREFVCTVQLAGIQEKGTGKSKKLAKRNAAMAMLQLMKQGVVTVPKPEVETVVEDSVDEGLPLPQTDPSVSLAEFTNYLNHQSVTLPPNSERVINYYQKARRSSNHTLPSVDGVPDYCQMLSELSQEQKFETTYIDLPYLSLSGDKQCLIQLAHKPTVVCHGKGSTIEAAHQAAAENALSYLDVLQLRAKNR